MSGAISSFRDDFALSRAFTLVVTKRKQAYDLPLVPKRGIGTFRGIGRKPDPGRWGQAAPQDE